MKVLKGIAASEGAVVAKAFVVRPTQLNWLIISARPSEGFEQEKVKFLNAVEAVVKHFEEVISENAQKVSESNLEILRAQSKMVADVMFIDRVSEFLQKSLNASLAVKKASDMIISEFSAIEDDYFRERSQDVEVVSAKIIFELEGIKTQPFSSINEEVIIVARDLTPTETIQLDKRFVKGFVTEIGGMTSHSAIVARSLGIPAILGVTNAVDEITHENTIALDGSNGTVYINPSPEIKEKFLIRQQKAQEEQAVLQEFLNRPSLTKDSHHVELAVNVGSVEEAKAAAAVNFDAIGLVRSEFLYMQAKDWPSEEEQFEVYKEILIAARGKKVVIRTLDIGGDKHLRYFTFPTEQNPFLGNRAIRFSLSKMEIFFTQLRALIRASVFGKLAIMFPMISTVEEFKSAKNVFLDACFQLENEGQIKTKECLKIEVGMMVETPAAAVLADELSRYSDFFSIGSNDLTQYTMAADRMNQKVGYLYQPLNPAVLRLINLTIQGAKSNGRWVGLCGEMGSDKLAFVLLVAMGIDEISMSPSVFLRNKQLLSKLDTKDLTSLLLNVSIQETEEEVIKEVTKFLAQQN